MHENGSPEGESCPCRSQAKSAIPRPQPNREMRWEREHRAIHVSEVTHPRTVISDGPGGVVARRAARAPGAPVAGRDAETGDSVNRPTALRAVEHELPEDLLGASVRRRTRRPASAGLLVRVLR